ncbi:hypothetical protein MSP8887_01549 [Marinomonas spartinae]|nr:hypothetical protein MSP8887_01549 [Marinomonas spartinae]
MFLFCISSLLWTVGCGLSVFFVLLVVGVEATDENMKLIVYGMIVYILVLQTFFILMLRYFNWARWSMVGVSFLSIILMIFAIINFRELTPSIYYPSIYYLGSLNLIAVTWSCFYFSSSLWVKYIRQQAAKYQAIHGYDPIQWRKENPRRLF